MRNRVDTCKFGLLLLLCSTSCNRSASISSNHAAIAYERWFSCLCCVQSLLLALSLFTLHLRHLLVHLHLHLLLLVDPILHLLLLVAASSLEVEVLLDQITVLVDFLDVLELVLWVEDRLLVCLIFVIVLLVLLRLVLIFFTFLVLHLTIHVNSLSESILIICLFVTTMLSTVHMLPLLLLHAVQLVLIVLFVLDVLLSSFDVSSAFVIFALAFLFSFNHHRSFVYVLLTHQDLVRISCAWGARLSFAFIFSFLLHLGYEVLIVVQELLDDLFRHRQLVRILSIFIL